MSFLTAALLGVALQQWDAGDPTPDEQLVLELINRARANPTAEGTRLAGFSPIGLPGGDIKEGLANPGLVGPRPPLAMNKNLLATARAHSQDMHDRDYFAHDTQSPPTQTWNQRINAGGYSGSLGENIAASSSGTASFLEDFLMVDWSFDQNGNPVGYPNRGHRVNLLDVSSGGSPFREIGVGYCLGAAKSGFKDFLTEDFGRNANGPFVVGVVYNDTNGNGFYNLGEGVKDVTVRVSGVAGVFAVTTLAGGYAFPANTSGGTITLEFTGGPFGLNVYSKAVAPGFPGENVKVDFKLSEAAIADTDGDGLPDDWENAHFGNLSRNGNDDFDNDGFSDREEFNAGTDPKDDKSVPTGGGPSPGGGTDGGGGGGCGLTGLESLLLLGLLRLRRRR